MEDRDIDYKIFEKEKLFNGLVIEWNKKVNLVSRKKKDVYDLIEESKLFFDFIDFDNNPKILDLGTGGGFPGIVLRIHYPQIRLTLIDSIQKKVKAVSDILRKLGLNDVEIICLRAEDLVNRADYKNKFDYVVAKAVASLCELTRWSKGLVRKNGKLITAKGGFIDDEINKVRKHSRILGVKKLNIYEKNSKKIVEALF
ncbi:MAG: 16S rRNA (guanine(527)-N(7))-methyltransferase RsmG [Ignavibacteria bacterium]